MLVALLHGVAVLLIGLGFLGYWMVRRRRPAGAPPKRRVSAFALESAATAIGAIAILVAVTLKIT